MGIGRVAPTHTLKGNRETVARCWDIGICRGGLVKTMTSIGTSQRRADLLAREMPHGFFFTGQ
jgi:hypothetical protein